MYVHRSNRMEILADVLAEVVRRPRADVLTPECIVVQGRGMERWLAQELARRLGIWANPDFPFPRHLVERVLASELGAAPEDGAFQPEAMLWAIADLLPAHLALPGFAPLHAYLADDQGAIKRLQLAERIATMFDQYVVYRPRMVLDWERGRGHDWQAILWRALVARHGATHVAARAKALLEGGRQGVLRRQPLPTRISLFGLTSLPPLYIEILSALENATEVHLFVLSPSREYWAEIRSQREIIREAARAASRGIERLEAQHLSQGHPLLASLGRVGREFQQVIETSCDYEEFPHDLYVEPGQASMLATLQSDILALRHRRAGHIEAPPRDIGAADDSISVHACHSPMREVEVIRDQLLALFEADPTLQPHDVVVMTPAIDTYAPFIDAVFATGTHERQIPYRIADRRVRATDEVIDTFAHLLTVLRGRLGASEILDLLTREPVRRRYGLTVDDLDLLSDWVVRTGVRWGADAAHRAAVGQPHSTENTWRFGLDRLLLGFALPGGGQRMFGGVLPFDDVEGASAEVLGRFADFYATLAARRADLERPRALHEWQAALTGTLETMIAVTRQNAYQHQQVRDALARVATRAEQAGFHAGVELDTMRAQLDAELERSASSRGFLTGGVTFCALVPMRSLPFRVVCLLGLNDDIFPRRARPLGFDLMAARPQPGDRSVRDDDRYLFLEALLSARERLLITYVGQSVRDGSETPPAVVVSELLDTLDESFIVTPPQTAPQTVIEPCGTPSTEHGTPTVTPEVRASVVVRHPLQAFSPRYFETGVDARLFSYARSNCEAARSLTSGRHPSLPFLAAPMVLDAATPRLVTVEQLVRFFEHPVRAFLQDRLGLQLGNELKRLVDREPLVLNALERWGIGDTLMDRAIGGGDVAAAFDAVRSSGALPPGALGACTYAELQPEIEAIARLAHQVTSGAALEPLWVDALVAETRLTGLLRDVWSDAMVRYQFSRIGTKREIGLWIRHLILNVAGPAEYPRTSVLVGRPEKTAGGAMIRFRRVDDAASVLDALVRLYWLGHEEPLLLFPVASRTYAVARITADAGPALEQAQKVFVRERPFPGEAHDVYVQQLFGPTTLVQILRGRRDGVASFATTAAALFAPLLEHREAVA